MKKIFTTWLAWSTIFLISLPCSSSPSYRIKSTKAGTGKIVFQADRNGRSSIYLMNGVGKYLRSLNSLSKVEVSQPALSRDGRKIVFTRDFDNGSAIEVMSSDDTNRRTLRPHRAYHRFPKFSPDGRKIAFISLEYENGGTSQAIYLMNVDGTGLTRLTNKKLIPDTWGLSLSPDGRKIAFTVNLNEGGRRSPIGPISIYVMNVDGTGIKRLTKTFTNDTHPCFSPDGRKIVFSSGRGVGNSHDIYIINADGTGRTQLTRTTNFKAQNNTDEDEPVFSPDGRRIAFSSNDGNGREGSSAIYVMNTNGTRMRRITPSYLSASAPSWAQ